MNFLSFPEINNRIIINGLQEHKIMNKTKQNKEIKGTINLSKEFNKMIKKNKQLLKELSK